MFGSINLSVDDGTLCWCSKSPGKTLKEALQIYIYFFFQGILQWTNERKARSTDLPDDIASSSSRGVPPPHSPPTLLVLHNM